MTKKVLITGKNSYIGSAFREYCATYHADFIIDELDTCDAAWKNFDFSTYESVFHVAGIAHNSADPKLEDLYYQVNRDLTIAIAERAKQMDVKQFIYMSSMIVYGNEPNGKTHITPDTEPNPDNFYGDSKLQAEMGINKLAAADFKVVILRPPMIYGRGSKGNYPLLAKLARKAPVFPDFPNKRSMLHIDNLCELVRLLIVNEDAGIFYPQNAELVKTSNLVKLIAENSRHKIWFTRMANPLINLLLRMTLIKKVFGTLYYLPSMSAYSKGVYQIRDLAESVKLTEQ